jgi:hypothetical protein
MSDDLMMRFRLQQVAAYRQLCASVRAGASHTLINAVIWLALTWMLYNIVGLDLVVLVYLGIGVAELLVGLWKKAHPVPEAVLADGLVLFAFGLATLGRQFLVWQGGGKPWPLSIFLGAWWLYDGFKTVRVYLDLCRAFPVRPTRDQIAWFDELVYEIRTADPEIDDLALDLHTRPRWKVKLLGPIAFFVGLRGDAVLLLAPGDFEITRERTEHGTGLRKARLRIAGQGAVDFEIDDASWANYQKWIEGSESQSAEERV